MPSSWVSSQMSTTAPIAGARTYGRIAGPAARAALRGGRVAMTLRLTKVKAVKAPKLMNDVEVATSRRRAIRPTAPVSRMLNAGVRNLGWT